MTEMWRSVPGWEGYYEVSSLGRVKSLTRTVQNRPGVFMTRRGRVLTPHRTRDGYLVVWLTRENARTEYRIHRLVLSAFVGAEPEGTEGCHNDGDKTNNAVANLRWDTRSANTYDKVRHGAHPMSSKTHCPQGHPYDAENTYRPPGRRERHCRTCRTEAKRRHAARLAARKVAAA